VAPRGSATINDGGIQDVLLGATAIGTTLSGGAMSINGGTASSTRVCAGGVQDVDIGGTAIGTTVGSGGLQRVADELSSSTASDTTVSSGGTAAVYGGGVLTGAVVDNGTVIFGGGTLSGNLTGSGSLLIESYKPVVLSGADAFRGSISISGSTLELSSATAAGSGSITIADTDSILQIDGPGMPTNIISGFQPGDLIDLQGVTFAADESVSLVGSVLHVVENGNSYNLQLDPARSYSDSFVLSLDFTSGTFITLGQQVIAGNATVAPGTTVSGELLVSGASLTVSSGGTADAITVNANEYVSAGGAANNTKVNGIQKVAGIASGTTILATQYVLSGGTTCETAIIAGGHQYVAHGGISSDTLIDGGAWGSLFGQPSGSLQILGGEAFDTTITGNGVQVVQGGTAIGTTISSGGTQSASNDPNVGVSLISNTVIDSGGILDNGDIAVNVTVNSAGVFNNYASAVSTTVNSGGIFNVDGSAVGSRVNSGGVISISGTETIIATGIDSFASVWVPGMASATTLSGGEQVVASGGSAAGTIISGGSGGLELIDAGGSANGTQVYSGGLQSIFGATSGTTVNSGGSAWIDSGGSAAQMLVGSDGHATVLSGGAANGATISGGLLELASGGSAVGAVTFAGSGGVLQVDDPSALGSSELVVISGIAPGDAIDFRNVAYSSSGSVSLNSAVNLLEISENNANHFIEFDPHQNLAKTSFLLAPDSGSGSLVVAGKLVPSGNTVSGSSLSQGFEVVSGNSINTAVNSGGIELIYSGATDTESTVNDNGFQYVYSGGAASNTVLNDPGEQIILAGGLASGAILSGGRQVVFGNVGGTIIGSDGLQVVESGGVASGSILQAGGTSYIHSFGQEVGAQISGGNSDVFGNATRDTIFAGSQVVESGGTASNTAVFSGGVEVVSSGGTAVVTTISGGKEELAAGAVASGAITFAGTGGTLKIDGTVMPANVVSGFVEGDTFDLAGVAFRSGGTVQVVSGHVLQVVENATTYNLQLDSSVSYATDAFRLTSDGSGGTDVIIHGPALSNIATSASYTEEGGAITLATSGTITDQDSTTLVGATVAITGGTFANDGDVLAATTSGTSITASYSSGTETLTLSGTDTLAHYQQVLRSVSFVAGENPTNYGNNPTRTVTWTVNDGGASFNLSPPQ
jgi:autotransporter passenger strand-loop-strand repeat protein